MSDIFENAEVIYSYGNEQAVRDGLKVRVGPPEAPVYVNRSVAEWLGCVHRVEGGMAWLDPQGLVDKLRPYILRFAQGDFHDPEATNHPEECNEAYAPYMVEGGQVGDFGSFAPSAKREKDVVWFSLDGTGLNVYFPEDR